MMNDGPTVDQMNTLADRFVDAWDVAIHVHRIGVGEVDDTYHLSEREVGLLIIALRFCTYSAGFGAGPEYEPDGGWKSTPDGGPK